MSSSANSGPRRKTRLTEQERWDGMHGSCSVVRTGPDSTTYKLRVYAGMDPVSGAELQRSRTFTVKAGEKRCDVREQVHQAILADVVEDKEAQGTVADAVRRYRNLRAGIDSPTTIRGREARLVRIERDLGRMKLETLKPAHIDEWYAQLRAETKIVKDDRGRETRVRAMSDSTIHHYHAQLRSVLRQAEKWELVSRVATRNVTPPPMRRTPVRPPTTAALELVRKGAPPDLQTAIALLAGTGMRRGELFGLRWTDIGWKRITVARSVIELQGGGVQVKATKTGRERTFAVGRDVVSALRQHRRSQRALAKTNDAVFDPYGWVFADIAAGHPDRPRRPGWLSLAWQRRCRALKVKIRLHDIRHWHATTLLDQGVSITTVSPRLGHLLISTTHDVYSHRVAESDQAAARVIERALRPKALPA